MKTYQEENVSSIRQQIIRLEEDYTTALQQGKEFEILKQIRSKIKALEDGSARLQG